MHPTALLERLPDELWLLVFELLPEEDFRSAVNSCSGFRNLNVPRFYALRDDDNAFLSLVTHSRLRDHEVAQLLPLTRVRPDEYFAAVSGPWPYLNDEGWPDTSTRQCELGRETPHALTWVDENRRRVLPYRVEATALHLLAANGQKEAIARLFELYPGADPGIPARLTLLPLAVTAATGPAPLPRSAEELEQERLDAARVEACFTPALFAAWCGHGEVVADLVLRGADPRVDPTSGMTIAHYCVEYDLPGFFDEITTRALTNTASPPPGFDPSFLYQPDAGGLTPLARAALGLVDSSRFGASRSYWWACEVQKSLLRAGASFRAADIRRATDSMLFGMAAGMSLVTPDAELLRADLSHARQYFLGQCMFPGEAESVLGPTCHGRPRRFLRLAAVLTCADDTDLTWLSMRRRWPRGDTAWHGGASAAKTMADAQAEEGLDSRTVMWFLTRPMVVPRRGPDDLEEQHGGVCLMDRYEAIVHLMTYDNVELSEELASDILRGLEPPPPGHHDGTALASRWAVAGQVCRAALHAHQQRGGGLQDPRAALLRSFLRRLDGLARPLADPAQNLYPSRSASQIVKVLDSDDAWRV